MPDNFWVPSHRFNSATAEQKGITQTIYTDSEPPSQMPNSLMPSVLRLWCDAVGDRTPASRTPSGRSNHYATRGRFAQIGNLSQNLDLTIFENSNPGQCAASEEDMVVPRTSRIDLSP